MQSSGTLGSNLGTKLISVLIAGILWSVVLGSRSVEVTKEVPIEVLTSPDIVASNDLPEKISFRIAGPKAFLRAILDRPEDPIQVNLVGNAAGIVNHRFFSDQLRVPIGVKVVGITPSTVMIRLEHKKKKEIPVRAELRGVPPVGFHVERVEVVPSMVRVQGAQSRLEQLSEISTLPIDVSSIMETEERDASLDISHLGVMSESPALKVRIVMASEERMVRLRNVPIQLMGPPGWRIEPTLVTILAKGPSAQLSKIQNDAIRAFVQLNTIRENRAEVQVSAQLPRGFELIQVIPSRVKAVRNP
jgi:YbbR domain-containing protein